MDKFRFWVKWLQVICVIFVVFGVVLSIFSQTSVMDLLLNNQVNPVFFDSSTSKSEVQRFQQWSYALLGSGCVFAGILMFYIAKNSFVKKEKWAWNAILTGLIGWFAIDSGASVLFQVYFNVILNTFFLLAMVLPLLFTKRYFK